MTLKDEPPGKPTLIEYEWIMWLHKSIQIQKILQSRDLFMQEKVEAQHPASTCHC
jgi:hypothetical protein